MKRFLALLAACSMLGAADAQAGRIERACKASDRKAATASLCRCVQQAANAKLTFADRRLAAKFFKKPDLAQETRQSSDPRKERFWKRYKAFGAYASKICAK
ncbi:hypothetical protein [Amylibacter sp. IMCC11727]|uniref:hypothetical protein n=1 Tax=Amylibacter sp. IMCC11727 TaxID=3039851 RepID=UPI00244E44D2|nr:hypothetical protein [Amylibacter sp. IMCC11727]WGI21176.1 hypothetical protein QBD29_13800 [Amylibacter sp. IMCC11727]